MNVRHFNFRIVLNIFSKLLFIEAAFLLLSTGVAWIYGENDLKAFGTALLITVGVASLFKLLSRKFDSEFRHREVFMVVSCSWILFSVFGQLPFLLSGHIPSVTDAFFETISGFTTTGASILTRIDALPHGLLFWRSIIQWLGGMGIIVMTLALLPHIGMSNGVLLFSAESSGMILSHRFTSKITVAAKTLWGIYILFTLVLILLLWGGAMNLFDAVCHAFTAMATGGFSTKQAGIAYWNSPYIEYVLSIFMILAGTNFSLFFFAFKRQPRKLFYSSEWHYYLGILAGATLLCTAVLLGRGIYGHWEEAFRTSLFQVSSLMTTTGYATTDYVLWGPFFSLLFFILMFIGGCAGSTSGGFKVVRVVVMVNNLRNELRRMVHPNAVYPVKCNGESVKPDFIIRGAAFLFLYVTTLFVGSLILTAFGSTFEEAMGAVVTCISGVGPGLGVNGPNGSFAQMHEVSKWTLSFVMLFGRLELFTLLVLFTPTYWKS